MATGVALNNAAGSTSQRPTDEEVKAFGQKLIRYFRACGIPSEPTWSEQTDFITFHENFDPTIYLHYRGLKGVYTIDLQELGWGSGTEGPRNAARALREAFGLAQIPVTGWLEFLNPPPPVPATVALDIVGPKLVELSAALKMDLYAVQEDKMVGADDLAPGTKYYHPDGRVFEYFRMMFNRAWRLIS